MQVLVFWMYAHDAGDSSIWWPRIQFQLFPYQAKKPSNPCAIMLAPRPFLIYLPALILANDFRTSNRACFLNLRTLNRSKSVKARLFTFWALFLAHALWLNCASMPAFSHCVLIAPDRAPRGSFSRTKGVRMTRAKAIAWRGTLVLESAAGPSTRTCEGQYISSSDFNDSWNCHIHACGQWSRQ